MNPFWLTLPILLLSVTTSQAEPMKREAGRVDYYVLALSWQPAFCEFHTDKPECQTQDDTRYDAKSLALHGLWPSVRGDTRHEYEFCGVSRDIKEKDRERAWCSLPALSLAEPVRQRLTTLMPGTRSCLERHEWFRHGACSGLSENEYFDKALALTEQLAKTNFQAYIAKNIGKRVNLKSLLNEFEKDYGPGSSRALILQCESKHGVSMLTEVHFYLKKDALDTPLSGAALVRADEKEKGGCKKQLAIDPAGIW
jgi:ribonuclease T2